MSSESTYCLKSTAGGEAVAAWTLDALKDPRWFHARRDLENQVVLGMLEPVDKS